MRAPVYSTATRSTAVGAGLLCVGLIAMSAPAPAQHSPAQREVFDGAIVVKEHLGETIPLDLRFTDEHGREVRLRDYFTGKRPVILNLGYYGCPGLCGPLLNAFAEGLKGVDMLPGKDFEIVSLSFDAKEKAELAREKKKSYVDVYGRPVAIAVDESRPSDAARAAAAEEHWHFLTGDEQSIQQLVDAVGFGFSWNEHTRQYDHSAVLTFLSPEGKIVRYLYGLYYEPRDLRLAIVEASEGKVGTTWDRILLSCYAYDPTSRTYAVLAWSVMRIGGALTVVLVGAMITLLLVRERRRARGAAAASRQLPATS